jgi:maltodextrin utilization protein YvdJ
MMTGWLIHQHEKTKPLAVMNYNKYKIGVEKLDQLLAYYSFQRKSVKWWKKLFFHLFNLPLVNAHILRRMKCKENFRLYKFMEKVAEGLVNNTGIEIKEQSQKSSARRLMCRGHYAYRFLAKGSKQT